MYSNSIEISVDDVFDSVVELAKDGPISEIIGLLLVWGGRGYSIGLDDIVDAIVGVFVLFIVL